MSINKKKFPNLYSIAGPNGAGKTTFAKEFLPHYAKCENFVNADLIAAELAVARIKSRAAQGGHDVPVTDVRRRFGRSVDNFFRVYRPLLDVWMLFDNSTARPSLIAEEKHGKLNVVDAELFPKIFKATEG